jgi:hypothetical protein
LRQAEEHQEWRLPIEEKLKLELIGGLYFTYREGTSFE